MNRFAILRGIASPPFKDDIAKEISEANTKFQEVGTALLETLSEAQQRAPGEPVRVISGKSHYRPPATYVGPPNMAEDVERVARFMTLNPLTGRFDPVAERQVNHMGDPMSGRAHAMSQHGTQVDYRTVEQAVNRERETAIDHMGRSLQYPATHTGRMSARARNQDPEDVFLTVRMPSGEEYRVGRDQIHIHHQSGRSNYGLHLNLPDDLARRIIDELHHPRQSAVNYEQQRGRAERVSSFGNLPHPL